MSARKWSKRDIFGDKTCIGCGKHMAQGESAYIAISPEYKDGVRQRGVSKWEACCADCIGTVKAKEKLMADALAGAAKISASGGASGDLPDARRQTQGMAQQTQQNNQAVEEVQKQTADQAKGKGSGDMATPASTPAPPTPSPMEQLRANAKWA